MAFSADFAEKLTLLVVGGGLSGLIVPYILKLRDDRKFREQKVFEAELSRQNKIIDSQATLLENIAKLLCEYQLLALTVTYYFLEGNRDRYIAANAEYDTKSWDYLAQLRTEITKSKRLVSRQLYESLNVFYHSEILKADARLSDSTRIVPDASGWKDWREKQYGNFTNMHKTFLVEFVTLIDDVIEKLASEFQLRPFKQMSANTINENNDVMVTLEKEISNATANNQNAPIRKPGE